MKAILVVGITLLITGPALAAQSAVTGRVLDNQSGAAIPGVRVALETSNGEAIAADESRSDGSFSVPVTDQRSVLVVRAEGYAVYRRGLVETSGLDVRLEKPATVGGLLIDESGALVRGRVTLISQHPRNIVVKSAEAPEGKFALTGLLPGTAFLIGRAENMAPTVIQLAVDEAGRADDLRINLVRSASVRGRVVATTGEAVPEASVSITYPNSPAGAYMANYVRGRLVTGEDGIFWLHDLSATTSVRIRAEHSGRYADSELSLSPGETSDVTIVIPR